MELELKLKPCPFCGVMPELLNSTKYLDATYYSIKHNEGCYLYYFEEIECDMHHRNISDNDLDAWNTRHTETTEKGE